jgi:hypothetical protein
VQIYMKDPTGKETKHRIVPGMTARGFLISPRVQSEQDLIALAAGESLPAVRSFSVQVAEADRRFFRDRIDVQFSTSGAFAPPDSKLANAR